MIQGELKKLNALPNLKKVQIAVLWRVGWVRQPKKTKLMSWKTQEQNPGKWAGNSVE
jgi:hypothetical protein